MGRVTALVLASGLLAACGGPGPGDVVHEVLSALEASRGSDSSEALQVAYEQLASATRGELDARAARASEALGTKVRPWDVIRFDGFVEGNRVSDVETIETDGDTAVVQVRFAWVVPSDEAGPGVAPEAVRLNLVREDGQWRVALPLAQEAPR